LSTIAALFEISLLNKEDFPTLGLPTIEITGNLIFLPLFRSFMKNNIILNPFKSNCFKDLISF